MKKREGFKGQRTIVLPEFIIEDIRNDPLGSQLYLTDIGYYPRAQYHHRLRLEGCDQYILIYCTEGKGWFSVEGKRNRVSANQYFIIPKGLSHAYGSDEKEAWSIYWVHFSGDLALHFSEISCDAKFIVPSKVSRIEDRIQLFEEIIQNLEMGYSQENINYANICLWHFLASFKYISQFRQIRKIREHNLIEDTVLFMKENLVKRITLEELSTNVRLSSSHYSMVFRKKTGRSPMEYLMHLRIQKACQLLDATEFRIKEVAVMVGYDDPYYFSRVFKKIMNTSPASYRKKPKG